MDPVTRGDPESSLRWTTKSTTKLAGELVATGHRVSPTTVAKLLKANGYSLQANAKTITPSQEEQESCHPEPPGHQIGRWDQLTGAVHLGKGDTPGDGNPHQSECGQRGICASVPGTDGHSGSCLLSATSWQCGGHGRAVVRPDRSFGSPADSVVPPDDLQQVSRPGMTRPPQASRLLPAVGPRRGVAALS